MEEVLIDRYVPFIDEVAELIQESGAPWLPSILDSIHKGIPFPAWVSRRDREAAEQRAVTAAILWYRAQVDAPAAAIVRERKAASPSPVRKVVAFGGHDAAALSAALDGIEPDLSRVADAGVLSLRVATWSSALHGGGGAVVASADHNILALYYGRYRPCHPYAGFYLVYDAWANSLAAVPQLPSSSISIFSHHCIGSGAAVLRLGHGPGYVLAELLIRSNKPDDTSTSKATLCLWCSSGPDAGRWIQREVILPIPSSSAAGTPTFRADTVLAVRGTSLCWVDLLTGILVCDDIPSLAAADHQDPVPFRFIPLPDGCAMTSRSRHGRGRPEEYRSMSCPCSCVRGAVPGSGDMIKFVSMDSSSQAAGCPITTWTLHLRDDPNLECKRAGAASLSSLGIFKPTRPLLSMLHDDVVYLYMDAHHVISVDMRRGKVISSFRIPPAGSHHNLLLTLSPRM